MDKIKHLSRFLVVSSWFVIFFLIAGSFAQWFLLNWGYYQKNIFPTLEVFRVMTNHNCSALLPTEFSFLSMTIGSLGSLIGCLPIVFIFLTLIKIFKNYSKAIIFSFENSKQYKKIGYLFLLHALLASPLEVAVVTLAGSLSNSPGHRFIAVSLGSANAASLLIGAIMILISWIMIQGSVLQEEQKFTI